MKLCWLALAWLWIDTTGLMAAISIQSRETLLTFDALPSTSEWRTASIGSDNGSPVITTAAQMDAQVQTLSVTSLTDPWTTQTVTPPNSFNYARWNSSGRYLQTRMGNNWFAVFAAILRNDLPAPLWYLDISYDVTSGGCPCAPEDVPTYRVYFSLTGEANSWMVIPALSTGATGRVSTVVALEAAGGSWDPGTEAYLLWADDNSPGTDAYYTLDNLLIATVPRLTIQPQPGGSVELSWREGWDHYHLESASHLSRTNWQTSFEPRTISGGRIRVLTTTTNTTFFRLAAPGI